MSRQRNGLQRSCRNRGFTLVELMFTVVVLAIITAAALPSFRSFIVGESIKSSSFDIMAALVLARSEALKRNTNVDVTPISGNWQNGWTVAVNGTTLNQRAALKPGVNVACYSGTSTVTPCPTVTYNNSGRLAGGVTGATPSIALNSTETSSVTTRCITVDLTGRPYSKKASCP